MKDFRSDTVTLPTKEMMQAVNDSILGDDVYEEDSTTNNLEKLAAEITGKEAALLVSSGTMGNLISCLVHCDRGTEAIMGNKSHTFIYESGGISAYGGIHSHQLLNNYDGTIDINLIKNAENSLKGFDVENIVLVNNKHKDGYEKLGPYDIIICLDTNLKVENELLNQLAEGGKLYFCDLETSKS